MWNIYKKTLSASFNSIVKRFPLMSELKKVKSCCGKTQKNKLPVCVFGIISKHMCILPTQLMHY